MLLKSPDHYFWSTGVEWCFCYEFFLQLWHPKIVHSGPKHKFCIILHSEGFRNVAKQSQWIWDNWSRVYAFVTKHFFATFVWRNSAFTPRTQVLHRFTFLRFPKCWKTLPIINLFQWSRMDALVMKPYSQLRYPQIVHLGLKHMFLHLFTFRRFLECSRTLPIINLGPME
jgi:hypothetical protein